jgi:hypothetical protein
MKNGGSVHMNMPGAPGASAAPANDENKSPITGQVASKKASAAEIKILKQEKNELSKM